MSGIRPSTSGNYINKSSLTHNPILNNSVLLPEFFQRNGYYVCRRGKLFHGYHFNNEVKGRALMSITRARRRTFLPSRGSSFSSKLPLGDGRGRLIGALATWT